MLINKKGVNLLAITEPFIGADCMASLGSYLNFNNFSSNEEQGGKLWIFWKEATVF